MGSIFFFLSKKRVHDLDILVSEAMDVLNGYNPDHFKIWANDFVCMGSNILFSNRFVNCELRVHYKQQDLCIVSDARLDYREDLYKELELCEKKIEYLTDEDLLIFSYIKWGKSCVDHIYGDFSFLIWDANTNEIFCARDHFGCRPFFYINNQEFIAVSSDPLAFEIIPNFRLQIRDENIFGSSEGISNKRISAFKEVFRLEPAHFLTFSECQDVYLEKYWDLQVKNEFNSFSEEDAIRGLRHRFIEAVRQRSTSLTRVGVELSGGLDSSSILSCLNSLSKRIDVSAFTHGIATEADCIPYIYEDEGRYSRQMASVSDLEKHVILTGDNQPGALEALHSNLVCTKRPIISFFPMFSDLLYRQVEESKINVLFSGFGGDEGATFSGAGYFEELLSQKKFKTLRLELSSANGSSHSSINLKILKLLLKMKFPKVVNFLRDLFGKNWTRVHLLDDRFSREFQTFGRKVKRVETKDWSVVRRTQYQRITDDNLVNRLEDSYLLAKKRRIEYRYPFLDVKLVEFHYSLPSSLKYHNGINRYVFRMAMKDLVPDEIRFRIQKSGATIPYSMNRLIKDNEEFREVIEESKSDITYNYVNLKKAEWVLDQFINSEKRRKVHFGPKALLLPISILILQKWQRAGIIDIGIKC